MKIHSAQLLTVQQMNDGLAALICKGPEPNTAEETMADKAIERVRNDIRRLVPNHGRKKLDKKAKHWTPPLIVLGPELAHEIQEAH